MQNTVIRPAVFRPKAAAVYLGIGLTTLWEKLNSESKYFDETFPKPFKLHGEHGRAVGFLRSELDNWLKAKAESRNTQGATP